MRANFNYLKRLLCNKKQMAKAAAAPTATTPTAAPVPRKAGKAAASAPVETLAPATTAVKKAAASAAGKKTAEPAAAPAVAAAAPKKGKSKASIPDATSQNVEKVKKVRAAKDPNAPPKPPNVYNVYMKNRLAILRQAAEAKGEKADHRTLFAQAAADWMKSKERELREAEIAAKAAAAKTA